ncbi:MAG: ABC transporter permease subunit [Rubricoccaceae bacterium]|nr:ABC transporter permease subunit [Rubricoccaceae bacterium]
MAGLVLLTLRELRAKKVVLGLFLVATLVWVLLASALQLDVVDGSLAGARLFGQDAEFGDAVDPETGEPVAPEVPFGAETVLEGLVFAAEAFVAGAAYWVGILLALFATGGLVASLLERGQVDLLLSKPLSRGQILGGRLLGVGAMMLALLVYLLGAVWLVMSLKTGVWNPRFLLAIGVVFAMFAVIYSVVTVVSVWTESAALGFIATLAVLFASLVLAIPELSMQVRAPWRQLIEGLRVVIPQFPGVGVRIVPQLATGGAVASWAPLLASLLFGLALYAGAFALFRRKDF